MLYVLYIWISNHLVLDQLGTKCVCPVWSDWSCIQRELNSFFWSTLMVGVRPCISSGKPGYVSAICPKLSSANYNAHAYICTKWFLQPVRNTNKCHSHRSLMKTSRGSWEWISQAFVAWLRPTLGNRQCYCDHITNVFPSTCQNSDKLVDLFFCVIYVFRWQDICFVFSVFLLALLSIIRHKCSFGRAA